MREGETRGEGGREGGKKERFIHNLIPINIVKVMMLHHYNIIAESFCCIAKKFYWIEFHQAQHSWVE